MKKKLELKDIVLIGRTFDEYFRMFDLGSLHLKEEKILDAASGVSSFCAEANEKGYDVSGADRIYDLSAHIIENKCIEDLEMVIKKLSEISDIYRWDYFKDINALKKNREAAYKKFLKDYTTASGSRYFNSEFPSSAFSAKSFTISLASHFLFMYTDILDYEFHIHTISELLRITTKEIRIFPLVNLAGERSVYVDRFLNDRRFTNYKKAITKVDYEFVRNGIEMLSIKSN